MLIMATKNDLPVEKILLIDSLHSVSDDVLRVDSDDDTTEIPAGSLW